MIKKICRFCSMPIHRQHDRKSTFECNSIKPNAVLVAHCIEIEDSVGWEDMLVRWNGVFRNIKPRVKAEMIAFWEKNGLVLLKPWEAPVIKKLTQHENLGLDVFKDGIV